MSFLLLTYLKIFVACSPIIAVGMYIPLRPSDTPEQRWATAKKGTLFASFIALGALLFGFKILDLIGVSMDTFRISGGFVLAMIAFGLLYPKAETPSDSTSLQEDISVTPVAFPIIVGPGAISSIIICKADAANGTEIFLVYLATALIMLTFYGLFYLGCFSTKWLKPAFLTICSKLLGLIVLTLGIQMMAAGIAGLAKSFGVC